MLDVTCVVVEQRSYPISNTHESSSAQQSAENDSWDCPVIHLTTPTTDSNTGVAMNGSKLVSFSQRHLTRQQRALHESRVHTFHVNLTKSFSLGKPHKFFIR